MLVRAAAKFNLFLSILGHTEDGLHELETILVRYPELYDELTFSPAKHLSLTCEGTVIVPGHHQQANTAEENLILKAVRALEHHTGRHFSYEIKLIKNIPVEAGLGGGSSDAATTLLALNELEQLNVSRTELMNLGAKIGMDIPFFISNEPVALGTHYGEKITALPKLPEGIQIKLDSTTAFKPQSTQKAFQAWDQAGHKTSAQDKLSKLITALKNQDPAEILRNLHNDFEQLFPAAFPPSQDPQTRRLLAGSGGAIVQISC